MKIKKKLVITLFLLCLLMIGAVSAANNDTVVSSDYDDAGAVLAQDDTKAVSNSNDESILKEDYSETSFGVLNEGNASENELDNDSTYNGSSNSEDGIIINETLNFEGNTINGNGQSIIFNINTQSNVTIKNLNIINGNSYQAKNVTDDNDFEMGNITGALDPNKIVEYLFNFMEGRGNKLMEELSGARDKIGNLTSQLNDAQSFAKKLSGDLDAAKQLFNDLNKLPNIGGTDLSQEIANAKDKIDFLTAQLNNTQTIAMKLIEELNTANQKAGDLAVEILKAANVDDLFNMYAKSKTVNGNSQEIIFNITTPGEVLIENLNVINGNAYQANNFTDDIGNVDNLTAGLVNATVKTDSKINKAANPLEVKAKTVKVKFSAVKKKAQTLKVTKVVKFTKKGQGTLTYKKVNGNKKITINKKTGEVTIKKGLKKGTYNVKVKIKANGNANYKASAFKTVTFKIKVQ